MAIAPTLDSGPAPQPTQVMDAPDDIVAHFPNHTLGPLLGQGASSVVYRATTHTDPPREVALKILVRRHSDDPRIRARFIREAGVMEKLKHPRLVQLLSWSDEGPRPYLELELQGSSLGLRLASNLRPKPIAALQIAADVCEALTFMHRHDVLHRDVKAANVFVEWPEDQKLPRAKLGDFGIVKIGDNPIVDDQTLTLTNEVLGTRGFMAPELLTGAPPSELTDVFSVGALLYECVVGEVLAPDSTDVTFVPERLPHFSEVLRRCTAKDPKARPQSANAVRVLCREGIGLMTR